MRCNSRCRIAASTLCVSSRIPLVLIVLLQGGVLACHGQASGDREQSGAAVLSASLQEGKRLYLAHCSACHGPGGEGGKGPTLALPALPRAGTDEQLRRIIRGGISGSGMPRSELSTEKIARVADWVRHLGTRPVEKIPGDISRGRELYQGRGGCAQCHTINGIGKAIGPDLTDIGLRRSPDYLRTALLEPEADIPQTYSGYNRYLSLRENFLQVRLVTRDGRSFFGVRVNEDTFSIQIRDLENQIHSFYKAELTELHKDRGKSPMPSYRDAFTSNEIDDLVAFLHSLIGNRTSR